MATSLADNSGQSDSAVRSAQGLLLTFKSIKGENFGRTMQAGADLAAAGFGDLSSNAIQLGKALENPTEGLSALSRSGITFSDSEKQVIEQLQKTGQLAKAQGMILDAINGQVGGTASAMAQTFGGQLSILGNSFHRFLEDVGSAILPLIQPVVSWATEVVAGFADWVPTIKGVADAIKTGLSFAFTELMAIAQPLLNEIGEDFGGLKDNIVGNVQGFISATLPLVISFAATFIARIQFMYEMAKTVFGAIKDIAVGVWQWISDNTGVTWKGIQETIITALTVIEFGFSHWKDIAKLALVEVVLGIVTFGNQVQYFFTGVVPPLLAFVADVWVKTFRNMANLSMTIFQNLIDNVKDNGEKIGEALKDPTKIGDLKLKWKPLTDGFKAEVAQLPKIAERQQGPLEKELGEMADGLKGKIGGDFQAMLKDRLALINKANNLFPGGQGPQGAAWNPAQSQGNIQPDFLAATKGPSAITRGSSEALATLARFNNGAAADIDPMKQANKLNMQQVNLQGQMLNQLQQLNANQQKGPQIAKLN